MTRVHQAFCLLIVAFTIWVMAEAFQLNYWTALGPGPGFFPFWLALFMAGLCAVWFAQLWLKPLQGKAKDFMPSGAACIRIVSLIISTAVFAFFLEDVGFPIMMFLFLIFLLVALGRQNVYVTLAVSIIGSFGIYYIFRQHLNVYLPGSPIEFLQNIGF